MAKLPGERYLVQQIGNEVIVFEMGTEDEIVRFNVHNQDAVAKAQAIINMSEALTDEEKSFAHFWSGYFYAHATRKLP